jgi:hypothetical protein
MDQSVMTFADSAARGSAITSPVEGMLTYLADSNIYEYWDGAAWVDIIPEPPAPVLQSISSSAYTVQSGDAESTLVFTNTAGTATFSTATGFSAGERVDIVRDGATSLRITAGAGVVFAGKQTLGTAISFTVDARYEAASVLCVGTNEYRVIGAVTVV